MWIRRSAPHGAHVVLLIVAVLATAPVVAAQAPSTLPSRPTEVSFHLGAGTWLPRPHPSGLGHGGWRARVGLQLERTFGADGWAWALGAAGAASPGGTTGVSPEPGIAIDLALTRRVTVLEGRVFAYAGAGPGYVSFDERRLALGGRAGLGLGTRFGVRVEARNQYLIGAEHPYAHSVAIGTHVRW